MSLKPLDLEQIQGACQIVLSYLSDPANSTPNNLVEGIASGKSLMRGVLSGELVICQTVDDSAPRRTKPPGHLPPRTPDELDVGVEIDQDASPE